MCWNPLLTKQFLKNLFGKLESLKVKCEMSGCTSINLYFEDNREEGIAFSEGCERSSAALVYSPFYAEWLQPKALNQQLLFCIALITCICSVLFLPLQVPVVYWTCHIATVIRFNYSWIIYPIKTLLNLKYWYSTMAHSIMPTAYKYLIISHCFFFPLQPWIKSGRKDVALF